MPIVLTIMITRSVIEAPFLTMEYALTGASSIVKNVINVMKLITSDTVIMSRSTTTRISPGMEKKRKYVCVVSKCR